MKPILVTFAFFFIGFSAYTQQTTLVDHAELLSQWIESGLTQKYNTYRQTTESQVKNIKFGMDALSPEQVNQLQASYVETSLAMEQFIKSVRNDLLDPRTRKHIRKQPEAYLESRLLELDMLHEEYYLGKFYPAFASALGTANQTRRLAVPLIAEPITKDHPTVGITYKLLDYLDRSKAPQVALFAQDLDRTWIVPSTFRKWEEIGE